MSQISWETDIFSPSVFSHIIYQHDSYIPKLCPYKPPTYSYYPKSTISLPETQVQAQFLSYRTTNTISSSRSLIIPRREPLGIILRLGSAYAKSTLTTTATILFQQVGTITRCR